MKRELACSAAAIGLFALCLLNGCRAAGPVMPGDARAALARIQDNYATIEGMLYAPGTVSFSFRDGQGRRRSFVAQPATLIFEAPRDLFFSVKQGLSGSEVARIRSNDQRYWLWVDVAEQQKLWWGTWRAFESGAARPLVIPPDDLLAGLMLDALPRTLPGGPPPLLLTQKHPTLFGSETRRWLTYQQAADDDWPFLAREVTLGAHGLPTRIRDFDSGGGLQMDAQLSAYRTMKDAQADAPRLPHRFVLRWPQQDATLRLDLREIRYRKNDLPLPGFPPQWRGEIEPLDLPAGTGEDRPA